MDSILSPKPAYSAFFDPTEVVGPRLFTVPKVFGLVTLDPLLTFAISAFTFLLSYLLANSDLVFPMA